jgi:hypothetical protein
MERKQQFEGSNGTIFEGSKNENFEGMNYLIRPLFRHVVDKRHVWSQDDVCLLQARS